jgi:ADP-heptose:LPS heptosyltransferase
VILQPELREKDRIALESRDDLMYFGDLLTDFDETAALCSLMDQVVSVDTSVAHLAGALGVRTHLLLPFNPDFRWLLSRSDSPWYPSMRLYRQRAMSDWCDPLSEVGQAFTGLIETTFDQQSATAEV